AGVDRSVDDAVDEDSRARDALADGPHAARNYDLAARVCLDADGRVTDLRGTRARGIPPGTPCGVPLAFQRNARRCTGGCRMCADFCTLRRRRRSLERISRSCSVVRAPLLGLVAEIENPRGVVTTLGTERARELEMAVRLGRTAL